MAAGIGNNEAGYPSSPWVCLSTGEMPCVSQLQEMVMLAVGGIKNPSADLSHPAAKTKGAMICYKRRKTR